jgi:hypothetical protein
MPLQRKERELAVLEENSELWKIEHCWLGVELQIFISRRAPDDWRADTRASL